MDDYQAAVAAAIRRGRPEVEEVDFDEDGRHVYLATGDVATRYRLGQECQRFLAGEFPLDEYKDELTLVLRTGRE